MTDMILYLEKKILGCALLGASRGSVLERRRNLVVVDDGPNQTKVKLQISAVDIRGADVDQPDQHKRLT
jgi:hypothetical protein